MIPAGGAVPGARDRIHSLPVSARVGRDARAVVRPFAFP